MVIRISDKVGIPVGEWIPVPTGARTARKFAHSATVKT